MNYLRRAIDLGAQGVGQVSPSPLVGCVITDANGDVVGEGTYIYDDVTHAEVAALHAAGERARGGTAYVSLEPHSHHGKTPPCTEALIHAGIARVVCPIEDPNPLVSGKGFERLSAAGVEVVTGVLADEAARQNEKFICWHKKGRPFVHLKMAVSLNAKISSGTSVSTMLSGAEARERVQRLRHEYDAILVGASTALVDDPMLTDRSGLERRRPLVRVILDNRLRLDAGSRLAATAGETPTVVFTSSTDAQSETSLTAKGVEVVRLRSGSVDLAAVLRDLKGRDIQSVLVEGGAKVAGSFLAAGLVDKLTFIYAPVVLGSDDAPRAIDGILPNDIKLADVTSTRLGNDVEVTGYPVF